jgi:hypothetical protein
MSEKNSLTVAASVVPYNSPECRECNYWNNPVRGPEQFVSFRWVYDVEEAKRIVKDGRTVFDCPAEKLGLFVAVGEHEGDLLRHYVSKQHALHVPMDEPVIMAYSPPIGEGPRFLMPIDGSHRIARAVLDGTAMMKAFVLSVEETDRILTCRGRKLPFQPPTKKARKKRSK